MSRKKIIIILIASCILILVGVFCFMLIFGNSNDVFNDTNQENNQKRTLNDVPENFGLNLAQDTQNAESLFDKLMADMQGAKNNPETISFWTFDNEKGERIPFSKFSEVSGLTVSSDFQKIIDEKNYNLFFCTSKNREKDMGVLFNAKIVKDYYEDSVKFMKEWEKTLITNSQKIIFSNVDIPNDVLQGQNVKFINNFYGKYAKFVSLDGMQRVIFYKVLDDSIYITSSLECAQQVSRGLESEEP